ncbi:AidA/PixA family protein [Bordetella genomosp. 9]|uniref:Inclusion body protein n=1 Tax=Bordetella genomosp. 9 TaxID=1416803 RepID=A0A1W6YV91_9BORD|nr:AidA/PixA family protein [Bordetella genomosp. 9]ARP85022.1 hypothetical protein CAL13_01375 [Bordetella genomosp. 9]
MSSIIDVFILHDAARIIQDHLKPSSQPASPGGAKGAGSNSSDTWIPLNNGGRSYVFLVAPWNNVAQAGIVDQQEGGDELQITLKVGDVIRYRLQNLPLWRGHQGFIEQVDVVSGQQCLTTPVLQRRPSTSTALDPAVQTLDQVMPIQLTDVCCEATMIQTGMAALSMKFRIYDDKAALQGNFSFSPWLTITA